MDINNIQNSSDYEEKISIITVCYNGAKTIRRTIESVLNQDFKDWRYYIIDGNSTDETLDIIRSYKDSFYPGQLNVISEKDDGIYDAMNKGIGLAQGKIIGIVNSDDWYEEGCLKSVWDEYMKAGTENLIVYGEVTEHNPYNNLEERTVIYTHHFLGERMIAHPACFICKRVYDRIGVYDTRYKLAADYDLLLRALEKKVKYVPVKRVYSNYSQGGASASRSVVKENIEIKYRHNIYGKFEYWIRLFLYYCNLVLCAGKSRVRSIDGMIFKTRSK